MDGNVSRMASLAMTDRETSDECEADSRAVGSKLVEEGGQRIPLSAQQERLWFLDRLRVAPADPFRIGQAVLLWGPLDRDALSNAISNVVARHDSLRTVVVDNDGLPYQTVQRVGDHGFELREETLTDPGDTALASRVADLLAEPLDLAEGPLFKATLVKVDANRKLLVIVAHSAVLDDNSLGRLLKEVSDLYNAYVKNCEPILPPRPVRYADYVKCQKELLSGRCLNQALNWWKETLTGAPQAIWLPFDRPRPDQTDYSGGSVPFRFSSEFLNGMKQLAEEEKTTLFVVLEAAFIALLNRLGSGDDLVVGTISEGRRQSDQQNLVGRLDNIIALRHQVDSLASFREHLHSADKVTSFALEHGWVPFGAIVEAVQPTRSMAHEALLQTMFVLQDGSDTMASLDLETLRVDRIEHEETTSQFDLFMKLAETDNGLAGRLQYSSQLFNRETIERFVGMFERLLRSAVSSPDTPIADLSLLDPSERDQVVYGFNARAAGYWRRSKS